MHHFKLLGKPFFKVALVSKLGSLLPVCMFRCLNTFYLDPKTGIIYLFILRESSSYGIGILCNMNTCNVTILGDFQKPSGYNSGQ